MNFLLLMSCSTNGEVHTAMKFVTPYKMVKWLDENVSADENIIEEYGTIALCPEAEAIVYRIKTM